MDPATLRTRLKEIVRGRDFVGAPQHDYVDASPQAFDALGGEWREIDGGRSFVVTRRYEASAPYGSCRVGDLAAALAATISSAAVVGIPEARAPFLFFDLETTGLSGGAGTFAFLVGCGWFEDDGAFIVEQHLLTDFGSEPAMLRVVASAVASAGALVTFNGKSFDAPVLETRYLFHRLTSPCSGLPHVDLLHPARRFWSTHDEGSCSLVALESRLLNARRHGDVSGFEIPGRYFQFIRTGDARPLAVVLEHNRLDLLSLAGLTARLFRLVDAGPAAAGDAREALALGRAYERSGDCRAEAAFERSLRLSRDAATTIDALRALALGARRDRRYEIAASCWQRLLGSAACPPHVVREALEALAIHHEHRARDLDAAKVFALKGLECGAGPAWGDAVRHRLARIERKMVSGQRLLFSSPWLPACEPQTTAPQTSS